MAQSDELMKGFQIGYQNAPFGALGSAIKSTLGRLTQQEAMASGLMLKGGVESMFRDPNERLLTKAKLGQAQAETNKLNRESEFFEGMTGSGQEQTSGESQNIFNRAKPRKFSVGDIDFEIPKTAEERRQEAVYAGEQKGIEEAFKQAEGIKRASKKIDSLSRQFNEALPSGKNTPVEQRIHGLISTIGAKSGIIPNAKLLALQRQSKLQLRAILRDMGEGARLSDQDINQNLALIEQSGLTNEERMALVSSYLQTTVDSMDNDTLRILRIDPNVMKMLQGLNVYVPEYGDMNSSQTTPDVDDFSKAMQM